MIIIFLIIIGLFLIGIKFKGKEFNNDYINKNTTIIINGLFVIAVVFKHFMGYIETTSIVDTSLNKILGAIGQLIVTTFLFYSGYGIMESIKNKNNYMNNFYKNRFIPTFVNFAIAVTIFLISNLINGYYYSIKDIVLAYSGWTSIGNSNWYMFATFVLYLLTVFSFANIDNMTQKKSLHNRIALLALLTIMYIIIVGHFKETRFVNTVFCYTAGFFYSNYKDNIVKIVQKNNLMYFLTLITTMLLFMILFLSNRLLRNILNINLIYNFYAILFVFIIVLMSMKFKFDNKIFSFLGEHVFWIYILQRLPMIILQNKFTSNYLYFLCCLIITIGLSFVMKVLTDKLWKNRNINVFDAFNKDKIKLNNI